MRGTKVRNEILLVKEVRWGKEAFYKRIKGEKRDPQEKKDQ